MPCHKNLTTAKVFSPLHSLKGSLHNKINKWQHKTHLNTAPAKKVGYSPDMPAVQQSLGHANTTLRPLEGTPSRSILSSCTLCFAENRTETTRLHGVSCSTDGYELRAATILLSRPNRAQAIPSEHHVVEKNGNKERKPTKKGKVQQRGGEKFSKKRKRTRKFQQEERERERY